MKKLINLGKIHSGIFLSVVLLIMVSLMGTGCGGSKDVTPPTPPPVKNAPSAPGIGTVVAGNTTASVPYTVSTSDGGSPITGYKAISNPGNITGTSTDGSPITVTGLSNGTRYTFTVVATNAVGSTASVASNEVIPVSPRQKLLCDSTWYVVDVLYWKGTDLIDLGPFLDGEANVQWNYYLDLNLWVNVGPNNPNYSNRDPNTFGHTTWKFTNADETTVFAGGVDYKIILLNATTLTREDTRPLQAGEYRTRLVYGHRKK